MSAVGTAPVGVVDPPTEGPPGGPAHHLAVPMLAALLGRWRGGRGGA